MKKLISVLTVLCIILGCCMFASAAGTFTDVPADIWYTGAVAYVVEQGYFNGVSDTQFDPSGSMTRGMFITVLGRMANVPEEMTRRGIVTRTNVNLRSEPNTISKVLAVLSRDSAVSVLSLEDGWFHVQFGSYKGYIRSDLMEQLPEVFTDVPAERYYAPYVQWAVQAGIVSGITETQFGPDLPITREQLCAILYNFSKAYGIELTEEITAAFFDDDADISTWAREAVYSFRTLGIINGRDASRFAPRDGATRAEVAVILQRYENTVGQENLPNVGVPFGAPVPESAPVTDSYFSDACFIGHSMVVGMSDYFKLPGAAYYAVNGISTGGLLEYGHFPLKTGEGTLLQALTEKQGEFKKIYILLGTNELGPNDAHLDKYAANMGKLLDLVQETQPDATVYLLATYPVSEARSNRDKNFNLKNILAYNERLLTISAEKKAYYLDTFSLFADANGYLPETSCASDGIHILIPQYQQLLQYLKTHVA